MRPGVTVEGAAQGAAMLEGMARRAQNPAGAYRRVAHDYAREMSAEFSSQGGQGGSQWVPLSSDYLDAKRNAGLSPRILEATRTLRDALTAHPDAEMTPSGVSMGTSVPYARFVHHGTATLPPRPILPSPAAAAQWAEWVSQDIAEGRL